MDSFTGKRGFFKNAVVRFLLLSVFIICIRFAYVITIRGESCNSDNEFCFFSSKLVENHELVTVAGAGAGGGGGVSSSSAVMVHPAGELSPEFHKRVMFYITVFQDLIVDGFVSTKSKALCVESVIGDDVYALKEIGVENAVGVHKKTAKSKFPQLLKDNSFDFVFSGGIDRAKNVTEMVEEVCRMLKPEGYFVVHTSSKDTYSFNSFISLFDCCKFVHSRHYTGVDIDMPEIHEIVMKRENDIKITKKTEQVLSNKCSVPGYKVDLVKKAEGLIMKEPLKPWIALKENIKNVKYLPSIVDISFKKRYVYVDVGSRSYGSSIVSWFKKQYPKQNKGFEIYAVEADKHFHDQYRSKKGVTLLPYAAWVKNESLVFEINQTPGDENVEKGRGMGRIQPVESGGGIVGSVDEIQGFDFAEWLKNTVTEKDFVVMKMDVEGTEFDLIPRLIETGAICLVDEVFLECHYNRWQKCCPGVRSPKYQKTYGQCMDLFKSLRQRGVLVHQWW